MPRRATAWQRLRGGLGGALLAAFACAAAAAVPPLAVAQVAPGVYVHQGLLEDWLPGNGGDVANLGFVVGSRCVAVIDTGGTPAVGEALRAAVARTTPLPVCYVINTHAHPDHVLGNVAFTGGDNPPRFVASAKLGAALAARAPYYRNALKRDFALDLPPEAVVFPTLPVDQTLELDLGGRVLQLAAWPTAHTDHDLTVYDRQTRTLFLSDLLFVQHMPALDGSLRGWLAVLKQIAALDVAVAVPGHGPVSTQWPAVLADEQRYLATLLSQTRAAIQQGLTIQQAVDRVGADVEAQRWLLADRFHRRNVTAAYAELEWE
ncbi:MAG TPA: quinoprotein relay system zinc metallohydrolase 2 [Ideonella sp.]|nr:quinoprotein relay system zinc metallohydrolase 2 [Ideonella sp.]